MFTNERRKEFMRKYLCKRILSGIFIIFISLIISFTLIHTAPGDPITILAGQDNPSPEMVEYTGLAHVGDILYHLCLPLITVTLIQIPKFFRIARSSVIQIISEDFITTFKAVGMKESQIFKDYVFKNAILPTVTLFGISLAYVLGGIVIVEIVFAWPGMGRLLMDAIMKRDYPLLMGIFLVLAVSISVTMIVVDIVYAIIDPRIRYK